MVLLSRLGQRLGTLAFSGLAGIAVAAFASFAPRTDERDELARAWLAREVARTLDAGSPDDLELAGVALAVRALRSADSGAWTERAEALGRRFGEAQRANGSFGAESGSRALTWIAVGALHGSNDPSTVERERRARTWLASAPLATGTNLPEASSAAARRALGFLRSTRTAQKPLESDAALAVFALAGGAIDLREAYAAAIDPARPLVATPAGDWLADPSHALAVSVAVLDHYRGSKEAALLAEASRPAAQILAELDARRDAGTGAWSANAGEAPNIVSTACALSVRQTLDRWSRALASSTAGDLASAQLGQRTAANDCEGCHATLQPLQVADWRESDHARKRVGCAECHGTNHSTIFREQGRVSPKVCGTCHAAAVEQFALSKHARAEETLLSSELFADTPPAARAACIACHAIGTRHADGASGSCNHCHAGHAFEASDAREPEACTLCHTGADYPQDLAYRHSKHGALYALDRDSTRSPSCATCHHPGGTHDDGFGITIGGSGAGAAVEGAPAIHGEARISAFEFAARRAEMVSVCTRCHSSRLAEESLREADAIKREGASHVLEAAGILRDLQSRGYFGATRELALGPEHARPDPAAAGGALLERYYEMWRFHHAGAWKGAYHQSASITNHSSGVGTLDDLEHIRAEAARWSAQEKRR